MYQKIYEIKNFEVLEKTFGIEFEDKDLLVKAFIHPSLYSELNTNYERLEFLGDSILQVVVSDYMYRNNSNLSEGEMSRIRALLVSENSLAYLVRKNTMIEYLQLGKSVIEDAKELSNSYVADIFESFIAAIYLDQGFEVARNFIYVNLIEQHKDIMSQDFAHDYKTKLQEILQKNGAIKLNYECEYINNGGFKCVLYLEGSVIGTGTGKSKKSAQQMAAKFALSIMVDNES